MKPSFSVQQVGVDVLGGFCFGLIYFCISKPPFQTVGDSFGEFALDIEYNFLPTVSSRMFLPRDGRLSQLQSYE